VSSPKKSSGSSEKPIDEYSSEDFIKYSGYDFPDKSKTKEINESQSSNSLMIGIVVIGIIFVGLLLSGTFSDTSLSNSGKGQTNDDIFTNDDGSIFTPVTDLCIEHSNLESHYHFKMNIYIDEALIPIPEEIGISGSCMHVMHTHGADNTIHVELPTGYSGPSPTLGNFFSIWGQTLSPTELLGETGSVTMKIGETIYTDDVSSFSPSDGQELELRLV
jgi:hypothetical protein